MPSISLKTAAQLTGVSKRTLWRRIAAGSLSVARSADPHRRTLLSLDDISKDMVLPLNAEVIAVILGADAGLAREQLELALLFLEKGQVDKALPWLELAAQQGDADAMLTLGESRLADTEADPQAGINWIRRAAIAGHPLAMAIIEALLGELTKWNHPHS